MQIIKTDQERVAIKIKQGENILLEHTKKLQDRLETKSATIDDIEIIMLQTMETLKRCTIELTQDIINDESKKKTKRKSMKNVERTW